MYARDVFVNSSLKFKSIEMYRAFVFVGFIVAVSAESDMKKCGKLMRPEMMQCCTVAPKLDITIKSSDDLKECFDIPMRPPSCEREECFAKKRGYYGSDGSLDKKLLAPLLEKEFKDIPDILAIIKEKCLEGDISKYGPPDMCDFVKMRHCIHTNMFMNCPDWSDKGDCSDIKTLIEDCKKALAS